MMGRQNTGRVLVLGDDMRIFLAVVRSLGRAGKEVHAAPFNWRAPALKSKYVSKTHYLPRYSDDPQAWLALLLKVFQAHQFDLVIPCCDRAILPLDLHRDVLNQCLLAIPNREAMELLFDKERTRQLAGDLAIPIAAGGRLACQDDADSLMRRYGLPLVLKPIRSYSMDRLSSWGKVWIVKTKSELETVLGKLEDRDRVLVEAFFVDGVGVGVSVLADEGKVLQAFQHRRLREGWGGSSSCRISQPVSSDLLEACKKVCERTKYTGVCMFEFRWNPDTSDWILLETNARFWGSLPLPVSLGVEFPRLLYDLLVLGKRPLPRAYKAGIRSRNITLDAFNLLANARRANSWGVLASEWVDFLGQPMRWIRGQEYTDSFSRDDLSPGIAECISLIGTVPQRLRRSGMPAQLRRPGDLGIIGAEGSISGSCAAAPN